MPDTFIQAKSVDQKQIKKRYLYALPANFSFKIRSIIRVLSMNKFIQKIKSNEAVIGIIGLGYVGIPLAIRTSNVGFKVIVEWITLMPQRVLSSTFQIVIFNACMTMVSTLPMTLAKSQIAMHLLYVFQHLWISPASHDLTFVIETMKSMSPYFRKDQLVSLESTTWPGTTKEILLPFIADAGFTTGKDFYLVYSPEREDPGNEHFTTQTIPKITVLKENIHRSVNIGLANEMKIVADAMGLNIFEVIDAAKTKPFGFTAYYPGPGIGGHCIPIDPFYLTWKAREFGIHTRFIELAGEINASMPRYVVDKAVKALNDVGKSLKGARVLALGIAYKRDVDDMRESPSVHVMELLREWGADVEYSDPNVPVFPKMREHQFDLSSVESQKFSVV
ncbi:UDP-N-acetyl-D-glucosamine 6-dehydrogenase [Nymphon striatum]|nr:UDP-N-acetyl-D-glucosamine 6-dehydrogenase [Nymphon striatum]